MVHELIRTMFIRTCFVYRYVDKRRETDGQH